MAYTQYTFDLGEYTAYEIKFVGRNGAKERKEQRGISYTRTGKETEPVAEREKNKICDHSKFQYRGFMDNP